MRAHSTMKLSKKKLLTTKFGSNKMKDDETFSKFYIILHDIINSFFNLGERICDSKVAKKY